MAAPEDYNDPFEFHFRISIAASRERKAAFFKPKLIAEGLPEHEADRQAGLMAASNPELEAHIENTLGVPFAGRWKSRTGVLSLTELGLHPLMWAHYADAHRGICLEYDTSIAAGSNPLAATLPVNYQADFPVLSFFYDSEQQRVTAAALTKSDHWQYEKEWRLVVADYAHQKVQPPPHALTAITLGARISSNDQAEVRSWVARLGHPLELRKAGLAKDRYALEIRDLDL